ncbi:MAG: glycosyltransferase family 4 protein [Patescibacteria group bacterium]|nr:glycosyltransferase family 4 protein [Patescibacteria group bacterium]
MVKILFLVTQSEFGGAQHYIFEVARNLDLKKYKVLVAAGEGDGEFFKKLESVQIQYISLKQMKRIPWPWQIFLAVKEIFILLKREKPDILFLASTTAGLLGSFTAFLFKLITKNYKLRTIYRIGGWAFRDPRPFWLNRIIFWLEKWTSPFKDKIIVNSEIDRESAIKSKIAPPEKIVKIYNGIDVNNLDFLSKEKARNILVKNLSFNIKDGIIIGTVANFYKTKGLKYLIEAANLLKNKTEISFLLIGEGKERSKLEALIKKKGLEDNFFLLGRISNAYRYFKAFDVFVLPSLKEGFPWVILEAMGAGLPIIATRTGALPEIIENGINGILVEPKDSQALALAIKKILENKKLAEKFGQNAKERVKQKFSLKKMLERTEKIYKEI